VEFFRFADVSVEPPALRAAIDIPSLPALCASIDAVIPQDGQAAEIDCVWGRFQLSREIINGGVRFTLPGCPNAFQWTLTTGFPPDPGKITIHCTIGRTDPDPDFIESIEEFADDWRRGLEAAFAAGGAGAGR